MTTIYELLNSGPFQGVMTSVIGNLITATGSQAIDFAKSKARSVKVAETFEDTSIPELLQKTAAKYARDCIPDGFEQSKIKTFLVSPECEFVIRQIFSSSMMNVAVDMKSLEDQFSKSLALYLKRSHLEIREFAVTLFNALLELCTSALQHGTRAGSVAGHEASSAFRHRFLIGELSSIKSRLDELELVQSANLDEINQFESIYRVHVTQHLKYLVPPSLDGAKEVPIDQLYVASLFMEKSSQLGGSIENTITRDRLLAGSYRTVVLGNPGGGKSTFAQKLCYDLARQYEQRLSAGRKLTPVLVILREYASFRKEHPCSILEYIRIKAESDFQLVVPGGAFQYLFGGGRTMIVFDGLDELLDTSDRVAIKKSVEHFATLFPSVPVLITSREVGYEQAPLDAESFSVFKLAPFSEEQIAEYVSKWFAINALYSPDEQRKKAKSFLEESKIVADIRSNPLMLTLMCSLYKQDGYIPSNRPDVYGRCAELLFVKWDKKRGIHFNLPFEHHIRPAMNYLAYWIYSNKELQGGVKEDDLTEKATEYLHRWCFEDVFEARAAAKEFIDFCKGRAWVFSDTGTTQLQRLYQFTHRTFLEYFTAEHLVQTHRTPKDLAKLLHPKIATREWDIVSQLAFQLKGSRIQGDTDELLGDLLDAAECRGTGEKRKLLCFAARCLEFMVPTPSTRRCIIKATLRWITEWLIEVDEEQDVRKIDDTARESMAGLIKSNSENVATVKEYIPLVIREMVEEESDEVSAAALHIAENLNMFSRIDSEARLWSDISQSIFTINSERAHHLAISFPGLAIFLMERGSLSLGEILEWHGAGILFDSLFFPFYNGYRVSVAGSLLTSLFAKDDLDVKQSAILEQLGELFLSSVKWTPIKPVYFPDWAFRNYGEAELSESKKDPKIISGAVLCFCGLFEACGANERGRILQALKETRNSLMQTMKLLGMSRTGELEPSNALSRVQELPVDDGKKLAIADWLSNSKSLFGDGEPAARVML